MEYKNINEVFNNDTNVLDGIVSLETGIHIVSDLTGINLNTLTNGVKKHSLVKIIENPSLLEITFDEKEKLHHLQYILDYRTGVE